MEEIDLCWRIWSSGGRVVVIPQSAVYHVGGGTLDKSKPKKTYLNFRNGLSLLIKNEPSSKLAWKLPLRILLDWVALLKFSLESGPQHGVAILKAHLHIVVHLRSILQKRKRPKVNTNAPRYHGWVIWSYFMRGKKKFSDLKIAN